MAMLNEEGSSRLFELTFEKTETVVIRYKRELTSIRCGECGQGSQMLRAEDAARDLGIPIRSLFSRVESGTIHFNEDGGELLICADSLLMS